MGARGQQADLLSEGLDLLRVSPHQLLQTLNLRLFRSFLVFLERKHAERVPEVFRV